MTAKYRIISHYLLLALLVVLLNETSQQQEEASEANRRWGPWTAWSSCSKSCGQGIRYRKRLCHNLGSQSSESPTTSCDGPDKHYKVCKHNCTGHHKDYRTAECEKYNGRYYGGKRYYWDAFINPYSRCELACKAKGPVRYYSRFQETVEDGTPCKLDKEAICIQGRCLDIGCDGIAGSGSSVDQCGICGGNGKSCQIISGIFTRRQLDKYGYNVITKIPSGACSINITELAKSRNYLALKIGGENGLYFLNGNRRLNPSGVIRGAGTVFRYGRSQSRHCPGECLFSDGPTTQDIEVQLLYYHHNPGIVYHFTIPKHKMGVMMAHSSREEADDTRPRQGHHQHHSTRQGNQGHHNRNGHHGNRHHTHKTTTVPSPSLNPGELNRQQGDMHVSQESRRNRHRLVSRHRNTGGESSRIQHGQSPRYIPAYDRNKQLRLSSRRRIIARTYPDHQRQPVRSAYANRRSNGQYLSTSNQNYASRRQDQGSASPTQSRSFPGHTSRGTSMDQRASQRSHSIRPHHEKTSARKSYPSSVRSSHTQKYHTNTHRSRSDPSLLGNSQSNVWGNSRGNRLANSNYHRSAVSSSRGYNNIQQIPNDGTASGEVYTWKISGFSECSMTCGGGVQETEIVCVKRSSGFVVTEENCDPKQIPHRQRVTCNNQPCPPGWDPAEWTACSTSCGKGIQTRTVECNRRISPTFTMSVSANLCLNMPRPAVSRMCENTPCAEWKIGKWEKCSTECGHGERRRTVTCMSVEGRAVADRQCGILKPDTTEICDMGSCARGWYHTYSTARSGLPSVQRNVDPDITRGRPTVLQTMEVLSQTLSVPDRRNLAPRRPVKITHLVVADGLLDPGLSVTLPVGMLSRRGMWNCNATCGYAVKKRDVVCMKKLGNKLHTIVSEVNCVAEQRPISEEACQELSPCQPEWYMTPWGQCSASCGTGVKTREVKCLDSNLQSSPECRGSVRPSERQACNKHSCRTHKPSAITAANIHIQKDAGGAGDCQDHDTIRCLYLKQSRLCKYPFYKQMCCKSCQDYVSGKHH
ncbi:LOW QUALITY PROTEIN: ADAMTS-like protein 4 [Haliotis rubra]|uniref:LOW QUALITY PROTEIN: ADAMTS-like protein 4 n=1 Tax=Haliotis rubra TaxID=36100 RepID=UPI001EE5A1E3|nr:LOW QUALITY PROTEIN: ADAMTS-like protein 4 [Haliotis rubra]